MHSALRKTPKNPRPYQLSSFEQAKHENTIVNLNTGLGKTLIACLLIKQTLSQKSSKLIIFLAPQVPLVEQQARVIQHEIPYAIVRKLHGQMHLNYSGWSADDWAKYLSDNGSVFVMTPAKFHDMLIHGHLHMNHIGLIIFDECHHVAGRDDYRYVVFFAFCSVYVFL